MNYGLPYMGSKSRICEWLIAYLPPADTFIDLFAGGCAVTHAAMISGKYKHVIANDVQGDVLELFHRAVTRGLSPEDWRPVSRQEFFLHAPTDPLVRLVWSFGNNCNSYLYGQDIEEQKLAAHRMIVSETIKDRYTAFQSFCSTLENSKEIYCDLPSISRLARIQALHGLARIQALYGLARIQALLQISIGSYDTCQYLPPPPSSSVVYADPPYIGTSEYASGAFNHDRFHNWLRSVPYPVYVSEYHMPDDFIPIAETKLQCTMSSTRNKAVSEYLFLHERFAHPCVEQTLF